VQYLGADCFDCVTLRREESTIPFSFALLKNREGYKANGAFSSDKEETAHLHWDWGHIDASCHHRPYFNRTVAGKESGPFHTQQSHRMLSVQ